MWRAPVIDDLRSAISSTEETTFRQKLLAEGQSDPFVQIFGPVTGLIRDAIRSHPGNNLNPDPATLPEGAIFHFVVIVRQRLCGRFNSGEQTETRRDEYKEATNWLRLVAKGDVAVEQAADETATSTPTLSPAVNESPRREGWRHQDGI